MVTYGWIVAAIVLIYIAICFGKIAAKHGKSPILYGILSIVGPVNLILLGYWAFSAFETQGGARSRASVRD